MRILIDVEELEKNGAITPQVASMLRAQAIKDSGSAFINIILAFGAVAIAVGLISLFASAKLAAFFGINFVLLGCLIKKQCAAQWYKLASIWMIIGALILCGALGMITNHPFFAPLIAALILTCVSIIAESKLLIALVPLALTAAIGGSTGRWDACYEVATDEPTITIIFLSMLTYVAWQFAKSQTGFYQSLAIIFTRMCIIIVNSEFWVGSFSGDTPGETWTKPVGYFRGIFNQVPEQIPAVAFTIIAVAVLILTGIWAAKHGNRFIVNTAATFGAIHFYTQWFSYNGLHALPFIIAGIFTVAFGLILFKYNKS